MISACSRLLLLAGLLAATAVPARADAIDGDWCFTDGRHFAISGPSITTPKGARTTGNYDRHGFSYVAPAAEPDAGKTIQMVLVNDSTLHLTPPAGSMQVWRRCAPKIS